VAAQPGAAARLQRSQTASISIRHQPVGFQDGAYVAGSEMITGCGTARKAGR
jgi:hypothetical protein